jgi:P27 family predicted phage terminase small subunit
LGRTRKPAGIRALEGNRSRRVIPREIEPPGRPKPPAWLTDEQKACFVAVTKSLPAGVLTAADQAVCERMAIAWATFREATRTIAASGLLIKGHDNRPARNPLLIVQRGAAEELERAGSSLGMSPASRTKITALDRVGEEDPLAMLMEMGWGGAGAGERQH